MTRLPIWRISPDYGVKVSQFSQKDGLEPPMVFPIVFSQKRLESVFPEAKYLRSTPAFSIGCVVPHIEILGTVLVKGNCPAGLIGFEENFERIFDETEKEFILAHEYSHIVKNHCPLLFVGGLASSIVKKYIAQVEDEMTKLALNCIWAYIETAAGLAFTKQFELDADAHALMVTGNREAALRTIVKIGESFAGDMAQPSHYIVKNKRAISVLTYQDRLDSLRGL